MTLDEAIKHAEETAIEQDKLCTRYDNASGYSRSHNEAIRTTDAKRCEECAEEHRQLAEWLRELKQLKEQEFCVTMREVSDDELKHLEERLKTERWQLISVKQDPCDDAISRIETIKYLNTNMAWYNEDGEIADSDEKLKAITDLINGVPFVTPQQQPCEDAISRQAAIDTIESWLSCDNYNESEQHIMRAMQSVLYDLPPVTPQPKMGRWIADVDKWGDIVTTVNGYRCSECNAFNTDKDNFCSNCGAKMEVDE